VRIRTRPSGLVVTDCMGSCVNVPLLDCAFEFVTRVLVAALGALASSVDTKVLVARMEFVGAEVVLNSDALPKMTQPPRKPMTLPAATSQRNGFEFCLGAIFIPFFRRVEITSALTLFQVLKRLRGGDLRGGIGPGGCRICRHRIQPDAEHGKNQQEGDGKRSDI
jgi:hypothetical protein